MSFTAELSQLMAAVLGREPTLNEMILIPMVPLFVAGYLVEWSSFRLNSGGWGTAQGKPFYLREVIANFSLGTAYYASSAIMNILYVAAVFAFVWEHRIHTIPISFGTVILAFFVQEFCYYCYHRTSHRVRWFWTQHVSHHSGEIMNMSTAARQSILNGIVGTWIFYAPAVFIGFNPDLILGLLGANLAFQWFVHTESVGKLHHWIEWWINTPSNHRVHHGRNSAYIDKNYGGVIMLYDHLFGTYQIEHEKVRYGIRQQIKSHNFLVLNVHEFIDMLRDVAAPGRFNERLKHIWKPPEWTRADHNPIHTWPVKGEHPSAQKPKDTF
ncbi:sterol desaturase [Spongiibacter sp. IMCC21906]|uniref:sterol desaturase family protein n=1 Tax=Spongiibacter sp. IMCC21906 TaxID=1620392 RepID=UPI00062E0C92|nr:sterol desaturase family protein [Spongiibacter sp. IMCC21906]AKH70366.1 sterol desaturase [Spongiibacter sp. IMCC21906]